MTGKNTGSGSLPLKRRQVLAGAAALGVAAASGAAQAIVPAAPTIASPNIRRAGGPQSGTLIFGLTQEAVNFNPLTYVNTGAESVVEALVFDAPWKIDSDGNFVPNLVTEMPSVANGGISADGLEWTLKLRPDVKWHDGAPMTARDVLFTFETVMNPNVAVRSRAGHDRVEDMSAPDDLTVRIKLKESFVPYMVVWQKTSIIPEHLLRGEADLNTSTFNTAPIGTGPFRLTSRVSGDYIEYKGNADYHGEGPYLETFIQKYIADQQTMFAQFQTGQIHVLDLMGIPPELYERAKALPGKTVFPSPSPFIESIYFNCGKPQLSESAVRRAIYQAIDKQGIIDSIYFGVPVRTLSYLPPQHWAYNTNLVDPGYDPARAAAMLDEAGWTVGADGIREKNGIKLTFDIATTAGNRSRERAQQLIQQNLKAINVDMQIRNAPGSVVWGDYTVQSQFDSLMVAWDLLMFPDPDYTARIASDQIPAEGGAGSNYQQYKNPEIDRLLAEGLAETTQEGRKVIYDRIQEILFEDMPFGTFFVASLICGHDNSVKGYGITPYAQTTAWNANTWTIG